MFFCLISVYSQDTTHNYSNKNTLNVDTVYIQKFIFADHNNQYINKFSPDTLTRSRFLWYPAKSLENIFDNLPGYYFKFHDIGQYNPLYFNGINTNSTGILRNGIPITDPADSSIDFNLLSRNEISELEFTDGYGNNTFGFINTINVIHRQLFQFKPYTEISFWQDRYENLYLDGNYHQNILKNLNFNFGITKHSYKGHYSNSDFDRWLGRFNLTFAPSNKLNFFAHLNYAKIQKGINGGLNSALVNMGENEEALSSAAPVINSDFYQIKERFDVDFGTVFFSGKNSLTKLQLFVNNSFVKNRDEENRSNPNGIYYKSNRLGVNYGILLNEVLKFRLTSKIDLISTTEGVYIYNIYHNDIFDPNHFINYTYNTGKLMVKENIDLKINKLILSGYINGYKIKNSDIAKFNGGVKAGYNYYFDSSKVFTAQAIYDNVYSYSSLKLSFRSGVNYISSQIYYHKAETENSFKGINNSLFLRLFKFDIDGVYSFNLTDNYPTIQYFQRYFFPKHYGNISLAWHDAAFKNKLEYKIGVTSHFWSEYFEGSAQNSLRIPANATFDFYLIGKIGRATFGLTVENILDRIIYNSAYYPFMDRGGFLNALSRFNITWNFFN